MRIQIKHRKLLCNTLLCLLGYAIFFNSSLHSQTPGTLLWTFTTGNVIYSSPSVADDGTIYIGSEDNRLHAINPDGTQKWQSPNLGDWIDSSPAIDSNGSIYVGSWDNKLVKISPNDGQIIWEYQVAGYVTSSPAISEDGTIYFGSADGNLYALNPNGTLKWSFLTDAGIESSPSIAKDGTIIFGGLGGIVYGLNSGGSEIWSFITQTISGRDNRIISSPAIDGNGNIYIGSGNFHVYSLTATGTFRWSSEMGDKVDSSPVVGSDNQIYIASRDGFIYEFDEDGVQLSLQNIGDVFYSSPVLDQNGNIYIASFTGSNTSTLFSYSSSWELRWSVLFNTTGETNLIDSSPTIAPNGTLYIGSYDKRLYSIHTGSGLAKSVWPKFSHDLKNTSQRVNLLPTIAASDFNVDEGESVTISNSNLAGTDLDGENSTLQFTIKTLPTHGMIKKSETVLTNGETFLQSDINNNTITYQHNGSETSTDSIELTLSDDADTTPPFTFLINVNPKNDSPIAGNDSFSTNEKTSITGNLLADNGNGIDSDPDGDTVSILSINGAASAIDSEITLPSGALLTVNENGMMNYDPGPEINALGFISKTIQDSYSYTITDKNGGTASAMAVITISGVTDTLEDLIDDLLAFMPSENTNDYINPSASDQSEWREIINQILNGNCNAITLPVNWSNSYSISNSR